MKGRPRPELVAYARGRRDGWDAAIAEASHTLVEMERTGHRHPFYSDGITAALAILERMGDEYHSGDVTKMVSS